MATALDTVKGVAVGQATVFSPTGWVRSVKVVVRLDASRDGMDGMIERPLG